MCIRQNKKSQFLVLALGVAQEIAFPCLLAFRPPSGEMLAKT